MFFKGHARAYSQLQMPPLLLVDRLVKEKRWETNQSTGWMYSPDGSAARSQPPVEPSPPSFPSVTVVLPPVWEQPPRAITEGLSSRFSPCMGIRNNEEDALINVVFATRGGGGGGAIRSRRSPPPRKNRQGESIAAGNNTPGPSFRSEQLLPSSPGVVASSPSQTNPYKPLMRTTRRRGGGGLLSLVVHPPWLSAMPLTGRFTHTKAFEYKREREREYPFHIYDLLSL